MTDDPELALILDRWLDDGPTEMPDRVIAVTAGRISRQRQRPAWRLDWRHPSMTTTFKLAAAVSVIAIVALVGYNLLPGRSGVVGGPPPSATPATIPSTSPAPSASARVMPDGPLSAGTYAVQPYIGAAADVTLTVTVPAGWQGAAPAAVIGPNNTEAPLGAAVIFLQADGVFADPCRWDTARTGNPAQAGGTTVGPSVDALVAALRANTSYVTSEPSDITIDGHPGKRLDIQLPSDVTFASCDKQTDETTGNYFVLVPPKDGVGIFAQGPGNRWHVAIFDVDGSRLIAAVLDYQLTPAEIQAQSQAIFDSIKISQ